MSSIDISTNDRRIQYTATSGQTTFPYDFPIFDDDDVEVKKTSGGTTTTLTKTTDYTVSGVGVEGGGNIVLVSGATTGDIITITGNASISRENQNFQQSGDFKADDLNLQLNKQITYQQELKERLRLTASLASETTFTGQIIIPDPVANKGIKWNSSGTNLENSTYDLDTQQAAAAASAAAALLSANNAAASEAQTGLDVIATQAVLSDAGFVAVSADLTGPNAIGAVAANSVNINAVVANETNINTVAADITNVNSVAGSIANVNSVALDLTNINNVVADLTNIDLVATDIANVNSVATNIADVSTCATNMAAIIAAPTEAANAAASADEAASYAAQAQINTGSGTGVRVYLDDTTTVDGYGGLLKEPDIGTEVIDSAVANNNTVFIEGYLFNQAQNRTKWEAGVIELTTWGAVSSTVAGNSEIIAAGYHVIVDIGTVTVTGTGTSRTATVTGATPFVSGDANADQTLAGYVQTAGGTFQITAYTSSSVVTIATPSGYANESGVSYSLHRYLCQSSTGTLTSTSPTKYTHSVIQAGIDPVALNDRAAIRYYGKTTATNNRTISLYHNGTEHYSYIDTPFPFLHDQLPGLNATNTNFHHLTTAEYNGLSSKISGTFVSGDLSSNKLTINHNKGLSAPYSLMINFFDSNGKQLVPDVYSAATNSNVYDFTNITISGTCGYVYI